MKKKRILLFGVLSLLLFVSCTQNSRARNFGGTANIELPKGEKLVTVTWKGEEIWYLTRPMSDNDVAETYTFNESSSWGIMEGKVIISEKK
jgi:hypothetical protein